MILLTVGMQLGFDRLIAAMDQIAPDLPVPVIAQIGPGAYHPQNMEFHRSIAPKDFEALAEDAQLIVSHAGIGTVLTARRLGKPIVLFPRRAKLGEHRNDHQLATIKQLRGRSDILIAESARALPSVVAEGLNSEQILPQNHETGTNLIQAIGSFIETGQI